MRAVGLIPSTTAAEGGKGKAASKTKYTCPACGLNAWGKPEISLVCGEWGEQMQTDPAEP